MSEPIPKLKTVMWRGWRRRCPRCGEGPIYQRWITLHDSCSHCGLRYLQDQGDLWAYLVAIDRALFILPLTGLFMAQMSGAFVLTTGMGLLVLAGLAVVWFLLLLFGIALFEREAILTRWK